MGHEPLHRRLEEYIQYTEMKHLAYNVAALQREKRFHSLAVLSFLPAEGKTLLCASLAMAYAEACGTKVLVVDTTTFRNKHSLFLKDCFNGSTPDVEVKSLDELRQGRSVPVLTAQKAPVLEPTVAADRPSGLTFTRESDFSLIKHVAEERSKEFGLVLLDTMPLQSRNKSNVDPLLVARLSDASALVVSRQFLKASKVGASLKILEDPTLHLIGIISNEDHGL